MKRTPSAQPQAKESGRAKMRAAIERLDTALAEKAASGEPPTLETQLAAWRLQMGLTSAKTSAAIKKTRKR